ncbi:MAG: hypothetical protein COB85_03700 [Bacteroidetes bacterium]|nr:MAG: hypothetical protein COB85_03700 [Bacteroidota bacterium]
MNKLIVLISCIALTTGSFGQTEEHKFTIYGGGGPQYYKGDVGQGFNKDKNCSYVQFILGVDYRLNNYLGLKLFATLGDLGYTQSESIRRVNYLEEHGENRKNDGLNGRMISGVFALQYNFANGCILPANCKVAPYLFAGAGINRLADFMKMGCIVPGIYYTADVGLGAQYRFLPSIFIGYQLVYGIFNSDKLDFIDQNENDTHLQNSLVLGFDF